MEDEMENLHNLFPRRIVAGVGWALHSLVFEAISGHRNGRNLHNDGHDLDLTDEELASRGATDWRNVMDGADYIVEIRGNNAVVNQYLGSGITLVFASGREFAFASNFDGWVGHPFNYRVEQPGLLRSINFDGRGNCVGIDTVHTAIHLPLVGHGNITQQDIWGGLPMDVRERVRLILLIGVRIDNARHGSGLPIMGANVWGQILSFLRGIDLLPLPMNE